MAPVQEEEKRSASAISAGMFVKYIYSGAGVLGMILLVILQLGAQAAYILCDWWLAYW